MLFQIGNNETDFGIPFAKISNLDFSRQSHSRLNVRSTKHNFLTVSKRKSTALLFINDRDPLEKSAGIVRTRATSESNVLVQCFHDESSIFVLVVAWAIDTYYIDQNALALFLVKLWDMLNI